MDLQTLQELNRDYVDSVQNSDVRRFEEILAEDFLNTNPDGTLVDRAGFLAQIAKPAAVSGLKAEDVQIRILGDVAIIHARTAYTKRDGERGGGWYTDTWAKKDGKWACVAAHVSRG
jgi:ketosteroid isomerase-like protein